AVHVGDRDVDLLEEVRHEDAELVGGALAQHGEAPAVREAIAVEHADRHVGIADVQGEKHYCQRTSPAMMRARPLVVRASRAPSSARPAVTPLSTPDGPSHSMRAPWADGASDSQRA